MMGGDKGNGIHIDAFLESSAFIVTTKFHLIWKDDFRRYFGEIEPQETT